MARNLGRTSCDRCSHPVVKLDEEPRPITENEAGLHFDEFNGLVVAKAHCPICQTKYLAWVDESETRYYGHPMGHIVHPRKAQDALYFDLSYQSSFHDEPGDRDGVYDVPFRVTVVQAENIVIQLSPDTVVILQAVKVVHLTPWNSA